VTHVRFFTNQFYTLLCSMSTAFPFCLPGSWEITFPYRVLREAAPPSPSTRMGRWPAGKSTPHAPSGGDPLRSARAQSSAVRCPPTGNIYPPGAGLARSARNSVGYISTMPATTIPCSGASYHQTALSPSLAIRRLGIGMRT
jgi:hypothetical protein